MTVGGISSNFFCREIRRMSKLPTAKETGFPRKHEKVDHFAPALFLFTNVFQYFEIDLTTIMLSAYLYRQSIWTLTTGNKTQVIAVSQQTKNKDRQSWHIHQQSLRRYRTPCMHVLVKPAIARVLHCVEEPSYRGSVAAPGVVSATLCVGVEAARKASKPLTGNSTDCVCSTSFLTYV